MNMASKLHCSLQRKHYLIQLYFAFILFVYVDCTTSLKAKNGCLRYYYAEKVSHPKKHCHPKMVLLTRCNGFCGKSSSAEPVISFRSVVRHPFKYNCQSCQDLLSSMKAIRLQCANNERVYATYRYILDCSCKTCRVERRNKM